MKKMMANWGLKLASLVFAAIIWLLVTNITDQPSWFKISDVTVQLQNKDKLEKEGLVVEVLDNSTVLESVSVYAPRSVQDSMTKSDLVATADLKNIAGLDTEKTVKIDITSRYNVSQIIPDHNEVKLKVEKRSKKGVNIEARTTGKPSDDYIAGKPKIDKTQVQISGAKSDIDKVAKAEVSVDVSGLADDFSTVEEIKLYDADGELIDNSNIDMNIKEVLVNIDILQTKFVPIVYTVTGEPASGYERVGEVESKPNRIQIAGKPKALSKIKAITVNDPDLNITGRTQDLIYPVELDNYLPDGITFADKDEKGKASVVVHIGALQENTFDIDTKNISFTNTIEGYDVKLDESEHKTISITLQGTESALAAVNPNTITGVVDLGQLVAADDEEELRDGTYNAKVEWTLPNGLKAKGSTEVRLHVRKNN